MQDLLAAWFRGQSGVIQDSALVSTVGCKMAWKAETTWNMQVSRNGSLLELGSKITEGPGGTWAKGLGCEQPRQLNRLDIALPPFISPTHQILEIDLEHEDWTPHSLITLLI